MNSAHKAVVPFCPLLARPARKQTTEFGGKTNIPTGSVWNIWYSKWAGGDRFDKNAALDKSETRCSIQNDCGYTRATKSSSFCIHFARGCCAKGADCNFWHRIPLAIDRVPMAQDVFGRDRHRDERDDMGGVGSFEKDNRTLYVGQLGMEGGIEDILYRHFIEWGEIEYLRFLKGKGVAFIRYKSRVSAEFAKEAMNCQSMDNSEILNVRWATEDPNPKAAMMNKRQAEEKVVDALKASLPIIGEHGTILDYQLISLNSAAAGKTGVDAKDADDSGSLQQNVDEIDTKPNPSIPKEIGWDTPNGFFYASNESAAVAAQGAQDQIQPRIATDEYEGGVLSGESGAVILEGGGPEKTQVWDGAKYVTGVGNSRVYTGAGQGHATVREKIVEAAVLGELEHKGIGVGGVSQGGAGSGGVAGLGGVTKGGFWPMLPQQQVAMKRSRVDEAGAHRTVEHALSSAPIAPAVPVFGKGVVSASTMQYLAELNERKRQAVVGSGSGQKRKAVGVLAADYGSDSD